MGYAASRGMIRFNWFRAPSLMANATRALGENMERTLESELTSLASDMQSYAQQNAPWKDRTGDARASLSFRMNKTGRGNYTIIGRHGVYYGGYLETGTNYNPWTGRGNQPYPIIGPTLQAHYAEARAVMDRAAAFGGTGASL